MQTKVRPEGLPFWKRPKYRERSKNHYSFLVHNFPSLSLSLSHSLIFGQGYPTGARASSPLGNDVESIFFVRFTYQQHIASNRATLEASKRTCCNSFEYFAPRYTGSMKISYCAGKLNGFNSNRLQSGQREFWQRGDGNKFL